MRLLLLIVFCQISSAVPIPEPRDGDIAVAVGKVLVQEHYNRQPFDDRVSSEFLDLYIDSLDYNHMFFTQVDIKEFGKYSKILDDETSKGNVKPAFEVFSRFLQRVEERVSLVKNLLKEKYTFAEDEKMVMDRSKAPWPENEAAAEKLWRQRVKSELLQERLNSKKSGDVVETISKRYDRFLKSWKEEDHESTLRIYLNALARAYDPHSEYMAPSDLKQFDISMQLSLVGIGAVLSSEDGYPKVVAIVPGGPADLDKRLKVNDRIVAVAQGDGPLVDVVDLKLSKAVEMIRGKKGTEVRLLVNPAEASDPAIHSEIRLKRDEIKLTESEAKAKVIEAKSEDDRLHVLGYLDIPSFYADSKGGTEGKSVTRDVARLLERLKAEKIEGLIVDLRRNGGGVLGEAIALTGLFIPQGPVVQVKDSRGRIRVLSDEDPSQLWDGPMVVLVTHISASASEIFAAALQDYGRAIIVGDESTFGKGTVQKVEELSQGFFRTNLEGAIKFTIQKFYRISGGSTQYRGVLPDIKLPSQLDYLRINEASLKNPLPYDEVPSADFKVLSSVQKGQLQQLNLRSQERVCKDPEFGYILEDIERLKKKLEENSISLNEEVRLSEKKWETEKLEKRKKERAERKSVSLKETEITLQSLSGNSLSTPAMNRKVMEQATANISDDSDLPSQDPNVDPNLQEGLHILADFIEMTHPVVAKDSRKSVDPEQKETR